MLPPESPKNKELKLSGKEMEQTFLDISQLKHLTLLSRITSKDFSEKARIKTDIGFGSWVT
jgi:hypothetical protein